MKNKLAVLLVLIPNIALADITGAGDSMIFGELMKQTGMLAEQIESIKETVDLQKRLEEMEQLKAIKQISNEGKALAQTIDNVNDINSSVNDAQNNPFGLSGIQKDINYINSMAQNADNPSDYAAFAKRLEHLKILGKANQEAKKKLGEGTNEAEDNKTTAVNVTIMTDLLINNEASNNRRKAHETNAIKDLMGGNGYSDMYKEGQ